MTDEYASYEKYYNFSAKPENFTLFLFQETIKINKVKLSFIFSQLHVPSTGIR